MSHSSWDVQTGPPHDGSMHALKPAGLPGLGRDPAPPSALWPRSPLSVAAAAKISFPGPSGIRITPPFTWFPRAHQHLPGSPGPSCVAPAWGGHPRGGWRGHGMGGSLEPCLGSAGAVPTLLRASPAPGWPDHPFPRPHSAVGPWSCCAVNGHFPEKGYLLYRGKPPSVREERMDPPAGPMGRRSPLGR